MNATTHLLMVALVRHIGNHDNGDGPTSGEILEEVAYEEGGKIGDEGVWDLPEVDGEEGKPEGGAAREPSQLCRT